MNAHWLEIRHDDGSMTRVSISESATHKQILEIIEVIHQLVPYTPQPELEDEDEDEDEDERLHDHYSGDFSKDDDIESEELW